jgi:flagellar motor protein MotB
MALLKLCALPTLALCFALVGCNDSKQTGTAALMDDNESLAKQLEQKNTRLNELGTQLQRERDRNDQLAAQLAACQEGAVAAAPGAHETVSMDAKEFQGIAGVDARVEGNKLYLTIADSLLFDSGKTALKDSSRKTLDQLATKIKDRYPDRQIVVVGHTDSDPIRKSAFTTNYHLGFERAYRVSEYLSKHGLSDGQMALMSYGPNQPQGSKEKSRRVEIIVTDEPVLAKGAKSETPRNAAAAASKATAKKAAPAKAAPAKKAASPTK